MVKFFLALSFFLAAGAQAKTLVVSDIDDTLKIAHVSSKTDSTRRAFRTDLQFSGMAELFQLLDDSGEVDFVYVSNAPKQLMSKPHRKFLQEGKFPEGELYLNENFFGGNHKEETIAKILANEKADVVIFLGDNSEQDAAIYAKLVASLPGVRTYQFIRMPYSSGKGANYDPVLEGQIPFITPMEILLTLQAGGEISPQAGDAFAQSLQVAVTEAQDVGMGPGYFPDWMDCRDFRFAPVAYNPAFTAYNKKITDRCDLNLYL